MENLTIALRSIEKNKSRNLLTMLGIIIGIASVICILAVGDGFTKSVTKNLSSANATHTVTIDYYSDSFNANTGFSTGDASILSGISGVSNVKLTRSQQFTSSKLYYQDQHTTAEISHVKKNSKISRSQKALLASGDRSNDILISHEIKEKLFGASDPINKPVSIGENSYVVKGTFDSDEYETNVLMAKDTYDDIVSAKSGNDVAKLTVESGVNKKKIAKEAVKKLKHNGEYKHEGSYQAEDPTELNRQFSKVLNSITYFVALVAGISLLIAGIGVMNVMYISVSERRGEIGIRRAFGATGKNIRNQFLTESVVLCVIGGILGIIIGFIFVQIINLFLPFKAVITVYAILISLLVASAVGLLFGFIPANKAAKSSLVGLLKEE